MGPFPCSFQRSKPRQIFTMSVFESYWANKAACDYAERAYYEKLSGCKVDGLVSASGSSEDMALVKKLNALEVENKQLKKVTDDLKAYHEKKAKKPQVIAKTSVLLDVKPWDDETDHDQMLASVKSIEMDGLLWGAHKLIPIGYGIKKLQVMCTVEDEKVSVEELTEKIEEFEDFVQSCDVNAMNKI